MKTGDPSCTIRTKELCPEQLLVRCVYLNLSSRAEIPPDVWVATMRETVDDGTKPVCCFDYNCNKLLAVMIT